MKRMRKRMVDTSDWHVRIQPTPDMDEDAEHRMMDEILEHLKHYAQANQLIVEICAEVAMCEHPEHQPVSLN